MIKPYRLAVFFGGCSSEYSVSLQSAYAVLRNINKARFQAIPIGISKSGEWFFFRGNTEKIRQDRWLNQADCTPCVLSPSRENHRLLLLREGKTESIPVDLAFPVLHGKNGEDGTVQGLIELAGIPLVGCGVLASALCMDKDRAHILAAAAGADIPHSSVFFRTDSIEKIRMFADRIGFPLFVKPVRSGSSYGITRVTSPDQLPKAVALAFRHDGRILLEENIEGFEVGCAVLGDEQLTTGQVDEIELAGGFFGFTGKYTLQTSAIHVPARIPPEKAEEIKQTAKKIYRALGCSGFARVDLFVTPQGRIVFNEVNTIPGFTEHSRYPGMMKAAGISFGELLSRMLEHTLKTGTERNGSV